eukprot:TRINITY_DN6814_c0_g1_i2.p1 TRINITY_DN6814_c0_g1~~TRINITY_DN6814_c0_g1_i2.p1  ORF type:complete len:241 (-),score=60.22 TRINITY_DN6814_c0_g1_i2:49-738(-)
MTTVIQKRNIVLGKTGAGKSTLANKITGSDTFPVSSSIQSVTRKATHTEVKVNDSDRGIEYQFKVVDTVGLFDTRISNRTILNEVKTYFRDKVPEGVNLVIFVFKNGRFTREEQETFQFIIDNFKEEISDISLLVITGCDNEDEQGRANIIREFKTNSVTAPIAKFMGKGIITVGFPETKGMKESIKKILMEDMQKDVDVVREVVKKSGEMRLGKEMFYESFWEKCTIL